MTMDSRACKFFLLAGGYGKRARPLSAVKPKPLFPLDGTPLLRIMLNHLKTVGLDRGFINLHHLPESICQCVETMPGEPARFIRFLYEKELSGSRILKQALPHLEEDGLLLVVNGDIFLEIPAAEMLERMRAEYNETDGILLVRKNKEKDSAYKAIITGDEPRSTGGKGDWAGRFMGRKAHDESGSKNDSIGESLMYTGAALFKKPVIRAIKDNNFFDSLEREKHRFKIKVLLYGGIWLDIGDPQSYADSNFKYKTYIGKDGNSNSLSENVTISPGSTVERSIIWENTKIKNKSVIKNCIVTGNITLDRVHYENRTVTGDRDRAKC